MMFVFGEKRVEREGLGMGIGDRKERKGKDFGEWKGTPLYVCVFGEWKGTPLCKCFILFF